jgi:hypothetical protein
MLGTTDLSMRQFRSTLIPPVALLGLSELEKFIARRRAQVPYRT